MLHAHIDWANDVQSSTLPTPVMEVAHFNVEALTVNVYVNSGVFDWLPTIITVTLIR